MAISNIPKKVGVGDSNLGSWYCAVSYGNFHFLETNNKLRRALHIVGKHNSMQVDEGRKCQIFLAI